MDKFASRTRRFVKTFPKKHHVEYITGILSVPVLLTAVALNFINLQNNTKKQQPASPTPVERQIIVEVKPNENDTGSKATPIPACKKEVGPISISSPREGQTLSSNPVCITINYDDENFCSVVWSYRINEGDWSEYNSNSPCLYGLPTGDVKFELRLQSTVSQDAETIERNFKYASSSASTQ